MPVAGTRAAVPVLRDPRAGYALFGGAAVAVFPASVVDSPAGTTAAGGPAPRPLGLALDKWVHAGAYGVLAGPLCLATRARTTGAVLLAVLAVTAYGFGIELAQANAAGAGMAGLAWCLVLVFGPSREST